jgi:uncharacterized protein (UPF0333 family)
MLIDNKGQISIELVLLVGLSLIIVFAIASYLGEDIELNSVMAVAKTGIIDASNDLAYTGTGNVIRFNNMTFTNGTIKVNIYSKKNLTPDDKGYMENKALQYIGNALNKPVINSTVQGKYNYKINVT